MIIPFPERDQDEFERLGLRPTYMEDVEWALRWTETAIENARAWGCQHPGLEALEAALAGMLVPGPVVLMVRPAPEPEQIDFFADYEPDADGLMWENAPFQDWPKEAD